MTTLLVIGAGREALPALQRAKHLGYCVVVMDGNPHAPGFAVVDDALLASTYDIAKTVKMACDYDAYGSRIDGVIALAADVPQTVAAVVAALLLPGISTETARLTSDKFAMKQRLLEAGVPIPWFAAVESADMLWGYVATKEYRLVLKPVDSRGARGVVRLTRDVDLAWAFAYSQSQSPTGRVIIEQWLDGPQISTETVLHHGWAETPGFIDRNYQRLHEFAPYVIEDGGSQPSLLSPENQQAVRKVAEQAARALEITEGTAKGDIVLTTEGPKVIEMAARLSGGYMSSIQVPLATDVRLVDIAIRLATRMAVSREQCIPCTPRGVAIRYVFVAPGHVKAVHGLDAVHALPGVQFVDMPIAPSDTIAAVTNHTQRVGCVIATGPTREEAVTRAEVAVRSIKFEMEGVA